MNKDGTLQINIDEYRLPTSNNAKFYQRTDGFDEVSRKSKRGSITHIIEEVFNNSGISMQDVHRKAISRNLYEKEKSMLIESAKKYNLSPEKILTIWGKTPTDDLAKKLPGKDNKRSKRTTSKRP